MSAFDHPRTRARVALVVVATLAVSSCGGTPSSPTTEAPTDAMTPSPRAASIKPSPPTAQPSLTFTFPEGGVPVVTREQTGLDERYINPGAVIDHEGTLHMFANLFTAWPGHVDVAHLVSEDGVTWTISGDVPALSSDDVPFARPGADVSAGFIAADGTWVLIFETVEVGVPWVLGRATADGPDGPWTIDLEPILEPGPAGSWDAGGLSWPSVVATDDGYAMYYTGLDQPRGTGVIGMATSIDGIAWTKRDEPVLEAELEWERRKLDRPRVARTPRGMAMVYAGGRLTDRGLAWSDDGVAWRRDGEVPVISQDRFPIDGQAWDAALIYRDGALHYYLEIGTASGSGGTEVYRAVAEIP